MKKVFTLLFLISSFLTSQEILYYDASGHSGIVSYKGEINWNKVDRIGPIYLDGSIHYFPLKFGHIIGNEPPVLPEFKIEKDTVNFRTKIDYRMGDYDMDILELESEYNGENSKLRIIGFKRSFAGNGFPAHYIRMDGKKIPIQQSYYLNYASKNKSIRTNAAVLLLNSDHNMIDADFNTYGKIEDRTLAGGIDIHKNFDKYVFSFGTSQMQEAYHPNMPFYPSRDKVRLNRQVITLNLDSLYLANMKIYAGIKYQGQGAKDSDTIQIARNWTEYSIGTQIKILNARFGFVSGFEKITPVIDLGVLYNFNNVELSSGYSLNGKPSHPLISIAEDWETWADTYAKIEFVKGEFQIGAEINYTNVQDVKILHFNNFNYTPIETSGSNLFYTVSSAYRFFNFIDLSLKWIHTDRSNILTDGIGDRLRGNIRFSSFIDLIQVQLTGELGTEHYFNRNYNNGFDLLWGVPLANAPLPVYSTGGNEIYGKLEVKISSMTIYGHISNLSNYLGSNFSFVDVQKTWTQNNAFIPPSGQVASLGIKWTFDN